MRTQRHTSSLMIGGLVLALAVVGALSVRGRSQVGPGLPTIQAVCQTAQPVAGGHAYCFVIDPHLRQVHTLKNAEYVGTGDLPMQGDEVP